MKRPNVIVPASIFSAFLSLEIIVIGISSAFLSLGQTETRRPIGVVGNCNGFTDQTSD